MSYGVTLPESGDGGHLIFLLDSIRKPFKFQMCDMRLEISDSES